MSEATPRVQRLLKAAYENPMLTEKLSYNKARRQGLLFTQGWLKNRSCYSTTLRRAYAEAYVLENMIPRLDPDELIVGRPDLEPLCPDEARELERLQPAVEAMPRLNGRRGHMTLDWAKLLRVGVKGMIEEIEGLRAALDLNERDNLQKDEFYEGSLVELHALLKLAARYAQAAREKGMNDVAEILEQVPAYPARTFREALQSIHFYAFCLWDLYFYGRMDRYLWPYYEADLRQGRITREEALELIDCFVLLIAHYITPDSLNVITLGGRDRDGNLIENDLTRLFLESIAHVPMATVQTSLLLNKETGEDIFQLALEQLAQGYSQPQIYNDDLIIQAMQDFGFPPEISRDYANCGCVEIVPCACSGMWPVSPYLNMAKMLLEAMEHNPADKEALIETFAAILRREVIAGNLQERRWQMERSRTGNESLRVSVLVNDCLAKGASIEEGGARYNHIQPNFLGMANVIDGIAAIDHLVYQTGQLTMAEFLDVLRSDYAGHEALRAQIVYKLPHFGTNNEETNSLCRRISEIMLEGCKGLQGYRSLEKLMPGAFSYLEHVRHGARTGATPDGRRAGYPLAAGSGPSQGYETEGPTASLLSATNWEQSAFLGGVANNMSFSKSQMSAQGQQLIGQMIRTFFSLGGMEIQLNVTDAETLKKARENPEQYRDLVVRVGGFNAYFVGCDPMLQQEIIDRNEHVI